MAKRQALLFELMREEETPAAKKTFWEQFFRKVTPEKTQAEPGNQGPVKYPETESSSLAEAPPRELDRAPADDLADETAPTRLYIKVNNYSIVLGITALLVILFCGYTLGHKFGFKAGVKQRSTEQIGAVAAQEPDENVLKVGPERRTVQAESTADTARPRPAAAKDISKNDGKITRKSGTNYLIIQVFRDLQDAERARDFLASMEVEASIEQKQRNKDTFYILVSAVGFANLKDARQRQEAEGFREQIKALGQQYRQNKTANGVDFGTCFYAKWPLK